jgi:hypothetical protein
MLRRAAVGLVLLATAGCRARAPAELTLAHAAESYVRLALALAERDPDSLDWYRGPAWWRADARARYEPLADIERDSTVLADQLQSAPDDSDPTRRAFLIRQLRAVAARTLVIRGRPMSFDDEMRLLFGVAPPAADADGAAVRAQLNELLPGTGDLRARYAGFDRRYIVPADRLPAVFARALEGCRTMTRAHAALPLGERVILDYVDDLPWSAFTRYEGSFTSRIVVNRRLPLTVDRVLDLACHEGYPGHHTIDTLVDARLSAADRPELLVQPLFSPQSLLGEGASSMAPELAFADDERVRFERDALFPVAGLDAADAARYVRVARLVDRLHDVVGSVAADYLSGRVEFARADVALERDALMPSGDATMKFLNEYRSYGLVYTVGRDLAARAVAARAPDPRDRRGRWRAYVDLVSDPMQALPGADRGNPLSRTRSAVDAGASRP